MQAFAELLDRLVLTPSRNGKLRLIVSYFRTAPDPDRGYALGALTGDLDLKSIKPAAIRELVTDRMDAELFRLSYDYVGDMAETVSLVWPGERRANRPRPCRRLSRRWTAQPGQRRKGWWRTGWMGWTRPDAGPC